ncbi:Hemolysin activation/secretion protein [Neptunomonas qingdaonensis]|uniref:Hemolysin activation/secretion protein n=1 Tax=Neptunomonas qingdaonensis TaxID=1045558 RepID=A0A1I2VBY2_9GAMM|nr:Hemolysin activation/secretion protein [Neptunomonas qingdaonensis]
MLALLPVNLLAATLPPAIDPAGQNQDLMRREEKIQQREQAEKKPVLIDEKPVATSTDDGAFFVLKSVRFTKSEILNADDLRKVVGPYLGKKTRLSDLNKLVAGINAAYREKGIFTAAALLPPQDINGGTVIVRLVEGKLGELVVEGNDYVPDTYVRDWIRNVQGEQLSDMTLLESDILQFNRVNDSRLQAELRAGKGFGLTDVVILVDEVAQNNFQLFVDNYGYESSGENEVGGLYRRYGLFNGSDRALVYGLVTDGNIAFSAGYNTPVRSTRWRVGSSVSLNQTEITSGDFENVLVNGDSSSITLDASWLAYSTPNFWLNAVSSAFYSDSETTVADEIISDYSITKLNTGAQFTWYGAGWQWTGRQLVSWVSTKNKAVVDNDQAFMVLSGDTTAFFRPGNTNGYGLLQLDYQYTAEDSIPGAVAYSLGGAASVRGYKAGVVSGDSAYQISLEAHYTGWRAFGGDVDSFVFYDAGEVYSTSPSQMVQSVGVGLGWHNAAGLSADFTVANAIDNVVPDQDDVVFYGRFSWKWSK